MKRLLLFAVAAALSAQTPGALLGEKESSALATRIVQLVESTAFAVPGLVQASGPIKQNAAATVAALQRMPLNPALTYQLIGQIKAYLALSDSMPRQYPFPTTAEQQYTELGDSAFAGSAGGDGGGRRQRTETLRGCEHEDAAVGEGPARSLFGGFHHGVVAVE